MIKLDSDYSDMATQSPSQAGFSRKPLAVLVDSDAAAKLFAQEAEYYQDITFPESDGKPSSRMIVDALDTLTIGAGMMVQGAESEQVSIFTETLIVSQFKAKSVLISCNTISGAAFGDKASSIVVSPAPQPNFDAPQMSGPGSTGSRGDDAGDIVLFLESLDEKKPEKFPLLDARGGSGQNGQLSENDVGGAPGYGGNGGNVTVVYVSPIKRAIVKIQDLLCKLDDSGANSILVTLKELPNKKIKLSSGETLDEFVADGSPLSLAMRQFISAYSSNGGSIKFSDVALIVTAISKCVDALKIHMLYVEREIIYPKILNKAGNAGIYGSGPKGYSLKEPGGEKPVDGKIEVKAVVDLGELPWHSDSEIDSRAIVSHMQAAMLLQKAKMAYFYGDVSEGDAAQEKIIAAKIFLDRLKSRLSFLERMTEPDVSEDRMGFARLKTILNMAATYQAQLNLGLDYYGHAYGWVPLLSLERYRTLVDALGQNFSSIETNYARYFSYLIENKAELFDLNSVAGKLDATNKQLENDQQTLRETAGKMAYDIYHLTESLSPLREALDRALSDFEHDLRSYFNFDIKALLNGLSTIAFAPKSGVMWITQGASWVYNDVTEVFNDLGETINKDYLVRRVASIKVSVDSIAEGFRQINDGLLDPDDPGANKLIAAQEDFNAFLDKLKASFGVDAKRIKDAFYKYVDAVVDRNNKILSYNAAILLILKKKRQFEENHTHRQDVDEVLRSKMSPALPEISASISVFYHAARDQMMELLYQMTRAYQFRALDNTNLIAKHMSENALNPAGMTAASISAMYATSDSVGNLKSGIAWEWYRAEEKMGAFRESSFPASGCYGAQYRFSSPDVLEAFKLAKISPNNSTIHSVNILIPAVYPYGQMDSELAGMSDIRLTNVRAWLDGVRIVGAGEGKAAPRLFIEIVHSGEETFITPSGKPFFFSHAHVAKFFSYFPDKVSSASGVLPQAAIFADGGIDCNVGHTAYALIGPFTTWEVRLTNSYSERIGILTALEAVKNNEDAFQDMCGKNIICAYASQQPISGKIGAIGMKNDLIEIEIVNVSRRIVEILTIGRGCVVSQKVFKGGEISNPNESILLPCSGDGVRLDFEDFTAIRMEFSGFGRPFDRS